MNASKTIGIDGMHCESCVDKITAALQAIPSVDHASVSLDERLAVLVLQAEVVDTDLDAALRAAGDYRLAGNGTAQSETESKQQAESLYPLILIVAYLLGAVCLIAWASHEWVAEIMMRHFMAGFFLVFSFFKLLDLRGFVDTYRGYDLLAKAVPGWACVYPFVELILGVAFLAEFALMATSIVTLVLMLVGAVGVFKALLAKQAIRCACLGTALNLPMTKVTLIEDLSMAAMALAMLIVR